ncbi:MAG TPA: hypothetical protein VHY35_01525 [Stellaceae bacterium]|nr:hypothetical protein [Stellaceae bacterium]
MDAVTGLALVAIVEDGLHSLEKIERDQGLMPTFVALPLPEEFARIDSVAEDQVYLTNSDRRSRAPMHEAAAPGFRRNFLQRVSAGSVPLEKI